MYKPIDIDNKSTNYQIIFAPKSTETNLNYFDALLYCQFLDIDGYTDWRLPTTLEMVCFHKTYSSIKDDEIDDLYSYVSDPDLDLELDWYWVTVDSEETSSPVFTDSNPKFALSSHIGSPRFLTSTDANCMVRAVRIIESPIIL